MAIQKYLDPPPAANRDKEAFELIRVWIAEQNQHVSLRPGVWQDGLYWGMMLADLAQHIVNAEAMSNKSLDRRKFLERIREGFDTEMDAPTDEAEGEITQ